MDRPGLTVEASERGEEAEVLLAGKLGGMSLTTQVLTLAMWPLLEQILAFFVGLTDILIAGRMAEGEARIAILDAMGLGGYIGWFIGIFQGAVATGVMALVSRSIGARDEKLASRGLGQGLWLGALAGLASLILLHLGTNLLIKWIGLRPEAAVEAEKYIRMLVYSGPISGALFAVNAALRGSGDTRTPFLAMVVVNIVNVVVSINFVFGSPKFGGGMGVDGIALGTVIGWIAGLFTVIAMLFLKKDGLRWTREGLTPHLETMKRISRIGVPQAVEIAGMWGIHSYGVRIMSTLPQKGALGAHFIAVRLEAMSFLPGFAIAVAASALTGQYLGAGSKTMAVQAVRFSWKLAVSFMMLMGLCFVVFRESLIELMAPGSGIHKNLAGPLLVISAVSQPFFATCIILKTSMRGAGATKLVMLWSFGSMIFYRVIVLAIMSHYGWITLSGVWIIFSIDLITQAIVFVRLHFKGNWLDYRV